MITKLLEKVSWKLRRYGIAFSPFYMRWSGGDSSFQLAILRFDNNLKTYALFKISFRLPNKTYVRTLTLDSWDFFFLYHKLYRYYDYLSEKEVWGFHPLTRFERLAYSLLTRII